MSTWSAAMLLLLVLDPLGNIPVFLSLLRPLPPRRQRIVLARELLIALGVLMAFLFGGQYVLAAMHLRQESVSIGGGIVLFLIGIKMIFPGPDGMFGDTPEGEPFIVPLAIPFIAGPSGMASVMLLSHTDPHRQVQWTIALLLAWLATAIVLFAATYLHKVLGTRVLAAAEKLMGMLVITLAVQMFLDGVVAYLHIR